MSYSFAGATNGMTHAAAVLSAPSIVVGCWVKIAALPLEEAPLISIRTSGGGNNRFTLSLNTSGNVLWTARTTASSSATSTGAVALDTWTFVGGEEVSTTERYALLGSTRSTVSSTSRVPSGMNTTDLGASNVGVTRYFIGLMSVPFIYNGTINDTQRTQLASLTPAAVLTPTAHWLFAASANPQPDDIASFDMTVTGATYSSDEPSFGSGAVIAPRAQAFYRRRRE